MKNKTFIVHILSLYMRNEFDGITKLRKGIQIILLSSILTVLMLIGVATIITPLQSLLIFGTIFSNSTEVLNSSSESLTSLISSIFSIPSIISSIEAIAIVFLGNTFLSAYGYIYLRKGFNILGDLGRNKKNGNVGVLLILISLGIISLGGLFTAISTIDYLSSINSLISSLPFSLADLLSDPLSALLDILKSAQDLSELSNGLSQIEGGLGLTGFGLFIQAIGYLLIGLQFMKLGKEYNEDKIRKGGILVIVVSLLTLLTAFSLNPSGIGVVIAIVMFASIFSIIAFILIYKSLNRMKSMSAFTLPSFQQTYQSLPVTQQPLTQIYQVGQGIIRGDGTAYITLYSSTQATIITTRVEGIALNITMMNPVILQPGQNPIIIKFDNVFQLIPGNSYTILFTLMIGMNKIEVKAMATYYS